MATNSWSDMAGHKKTTSSPKRYFLKTGWGPGTGDETKKQMGSNLLQVQKQMNKQKRKLKASDKKPEQGADIEATALAPNSREESESPRWHPVLQHSKKMGS
eukprot:CAMPEP_0195006112 /NCGR_PEP_ID=MMETSP0326_2-20130528/6391_1 /TAXON_ID=2866 ORGANISM="Crypthecodinium cohnii, Strain Seligo" /NCGR_SAMPLE_ID=MMETSP0326_2 /ASSEMBLY_ACC=CAM_ASM_000348 /LENGTH=101 /DNA_ID=CAMNT_0040012687 /DNA_START=77 /DNA_END=383 /DNA_ORIENTATION=-